MKPSSSVQHSDCILISSFLERVVHMHRSVDFFLWSLSVFFLVFIPTKIVGITIYTISAAMNFVWPLNSVCFSVLSVLWTESEHTLRQGYSETIHVLRHTEISGEGEHYVQLFEVQKSRHFVSLQSLLSSGIYHAFLYTSLYTMRRSLRFFSRRWHKIFSRIPELSIT